MSGINEGDGNPILAPEVMKEGATEANTLPYLLDRQYFTILQVPLNILLVSDVSFAWA